MKTITKVYLSDDDLGEVEGMFDENDEVIGHWHSNDASWRDEYFSGFMKNLGVKVVSAKPTKKQVRLLREAFGI